MLQLIARRLRHVAGRTSSRSQFYDMAASAPLASAAALTAGTVVGVAGLSPIAMSTRHSDDCSRAPRMVYTDCFDMQMSMISVADADGAPGVSDNDGEGRLLLQLFLVERQSDEGSGGLGGSRERRAGCFSLAAEGSGSRGLA
eukprot:gnl/TRDRNA2_/TRDRNA2_159350_c0_seq4.p1 gnl/TRDRNA2_/TRDRNA2_159350_c0~~gnl/TRDRNA2_/TRDRNA2_159350_c0_seq4.p1  ORF type:complete len:143 (-),score=18.46 gnl/TRDRNA2_/TRDRNA2_159350_c0_seq4:49-477(-)